ncbi:unnamed protein product [Linum tenue]|uniref:Uncharacterized protein n=1 Tax=Linum tenue TaxID=586396 RepID=A0AAV0NEJ5_9ROSI|nr:unnamed protein product [Linum tenue]
MPPTYLPLRWESTGDQWWYAAPIDWAAANGHYDLVRQLLKIDNNHLINLTSLRRIRRLETVWDDEQSSSSSSLDVAKCRSHVARKLFIECESSKTSGGKSNSLVASGYGGWLMYTAASAGDLNFVQELLQKNPLLVFGEGEYGVTDILYAAARSKNSEVFRLVYDFAVSPRFLAAKGGGLEEHLGDIPLTYKWEMLNRAVHAAARGGNVALLKDLLTNCSDEILSYRDKQGSTILHAAAAKGQVEVIKYLISTFEMINSTDNQGNTALHIAAYRGQLHVFQALVEASPSMLASTNNAGETFLHMAVSGFQNPAFRRLDKQIELMKQLIRGGSFHIEQMINAKNNDGRTALHTAILANMHSDLVQLLMAVESIEVNARDADGMTVLDLLKQRPRSASSDVLIRKLISAGGIFSCHDYTARRAIASRLKLQSGLGSPGTSFRLSDTEVFLYTGVEVQANGGQGNGGMSSSSLELNQVDYTTAKKEEDETPSHAAQGLKRVLQWTRKKHRKPAEGHNRNCSVASSSRRCSTVTAASTTASDENQAAAPLRHRFSTKPSSTPPPTASNKRTLAVRSNQSSPTAKKKLASGALVHGVVQALPQIAVPGARSRSSSFSKSSLSSPCSKGVFGEAEGLDGGSPSLKHNHHQHHRRSRSQYFCFGGSGVSVKSPVSSSRHRRQQSASYTPSVVSVA